ncbi:MAG: ATP-binding protein [Alistipes indistinctus]
MLNIIKNSYEAIGNGGEIRISSEPVEIIVEDNRPGIPEETGRKLFSPFFTTKPGGQGIGLMFVREVLNNHGPHIPAQLRNRAGPRSSFHSQSRTIATPGRWPAKNYRKLPSPPRNLSD